MNKKRDLICLLCNSRRFEAFHDKFRYGEKCHAVKCGNCGLVMLKEVEPLRYYDNFYKQNYASKYYKGEKRDFNRRFDLFYKLQDRRIRYCNFAEKKLRPHFKIPE